MGHNQGSTTIAYSYATCGQMDVFTAEHNPGAIGKKLCVTAAPTQNPTPAPTATPTAPPTPTPTAAPTPAPPLESDASAAVHVVLCGGVIATIVGGLAMP